MQLTWEGHLTFTLRLGESFRHVPNHLDYVIGGARPVSRLDGGRVDEAIRKWGGGGRTLGVFPSRRGLGRAGEHGAGFDNLEEHLGLSRSYRLDIADARQTTSVRDALRNLAMVESAATQMLVATPLSLAASAAPPRDLSMAALEPYRRTRIPEAHAIEPGEEDTTVAVVDTGVALGHPELQRKCLAGYNTVDLGLGQLNPSLRLVGDSWGVGFHPQDQVGHGSMVAGIVGAQGWRVHRGVAAKSLVLPVRVLAAAQSSVDGPRMGVGSLADIDAGMKVAVDLGADVINMSYGTPASALQPGDPLPHTRVIQYALRYGCTLVAAAGNRGDDDTYYPPGCPTSSRSDRSTRRTAVPVSARSASTCACARRESRSTVLNRRGYRSNSGTSFAAPFVAGSRH